MSMFTVRLKRQRISYHYDASGALVAENREEIEAVYSDLPASTAQNYARAFPDASVVIERQPESFDRRSDKGKIRRVRMTRDTVEVEREEPNDSSDVIDLSKIASNPYAALVNSAMREAGE